MNEEKINLVEGPITAETLAEKHNVLGRGLTQFTTPVDASALISKKGQFGKEIEVDDNPGEYYRHEITSADLSTKHIELDSASELVNAERPAIEHPVVNIVVNQEENTVTATYGGKTLIERNPGDWFVQGAFQVNHVALRLAWKTKFKEVLPSEFQTSFSFNGGFSMGGKRNLFTAPPARPKRVSKHASGQSKKKKRK